MDAARRRPFARETGLAVAVIASVALCLFVNTAAFRFWRQWDWTGTRLYTLSPQTEQVVRGLARDVRITGFLVEGGAVGRDVLDQVRTVIAQYGRLNPARLSIEWIDPARDPARARSVLAQFNLDPLRDPIDVVIVQSGARRKQVRLTDMVEFDPAVPGEAAPPVRSLKVESALTGAILGVTRDRQPVVRFATGHGEHAYTAADEAGLARFVEGLEQQDVKVDAWDALGAREVPAGTDVIVVAGPSTPWLPGDAAALSTYLDRGGRALLLLDPALRGAGELVPTGLEPLLARWGVTLDGDIVIDPRRGVPFFGAETFFADTLGLHPVTSSLGGQPVLFRLARSLQLARPTPAGTLLSSLAETSDGSWGETDLAHLDAIKLDGSDRKGPLVIAAAAERTGAQGRPGRLVVVGDSDLVANAIIDQLANRSFANNAVSWLLEEDRALAIPPKDRTLSKLFLTQAQTTALFFVLVVLFPAFGIGCGLAVWSRRRRS